MFYVRINIFLNNIMILTTETCLQAYKIKFFMEYMNGQMTCKQLTRVNLTDRGEGGGNLTGRGVCVKNCPMVLLR